MRKKVILCLILVLLSSMMCFLMNACDFTVEEEQTITYTVTLNANDGTIEGTVTSYTFGKGVTLPTNVTKLGYAFDGWFASEDLSGEAVTAIGTEETGARTFYAKWSIVNYTLKVKYNYKDDVDEIEFNIENKEDKLTEVLGKKPEDTVEYIYTWSEQPTQLQLSNDQEFTINKTANSFTVTLNANDGTIEGTVTSYTYGVGATLPTNVTKEGYTFDGWFASEDLTGEAVTAIGVDETLNKTFYAKWTINQYTLSFVDENNQAIEGCEAITQDYNTEITLPTLTCVKLGYTYAWFNGDDNFTSSTMPAGNVTLTSKLVKQATNTFDSVTDTSATVNITEAKNEYVYFSEFTDSDIYLSADITVTGVCLDQDWRIGFSIFGETENKVIYNILLERNAQNATPAKRIIALPKTSENKNDWNGKSYNFTTQPDLANGIKFAMYKTGSMLYVLVDGNVVLSLDASTEFSEGDTTIQADGKYSYGLVSWNCTSATFNNITYNTAPTSEFVADFMGSAQIVKTKISSSGWNVNKVDGNDVTIASSVTQANTQTARFNTTDSQQLEDSYIETYITLTTPVTDQDCRVGFGIYDETDDVEIFNILFDLTGKNVTTAKRIIILPRTVKNGNGWNGKTYTFATDAQPDLKSGIKFALYRKGAYLYVFINDVQVLSCDATEAGNYTDIAWRTLNTTHQIVYGVTAWNVSKATFKNTQIYVGNDLITRKLEHLGVTVKEVKIFTVTLNANDGVIEKDVTAYTYGEGVTLPTNVTKEGYTFAGWFASEDLTGEAVTAINAEETGNKTYYAKWTAVNYTAKVKYSFKEDVDEIEFNIENKADKIAELLAKKPDDTTGYSFAWVEEPTELELNNTQEFTVNRTANSFTVTLNVNDGVVVEGDVTSYTYGEGVTLPTNVTKEGYTFAGWFASEDLTGDAVTAIGTEEAGNKTYYAKWTVINYTAKVKYSFKEDVDEIEFNIENKADKLAELLAKKPDDTTEYCYSWAVEPIELKLNNDQEFTVNRAVNGFAVILNTNEGVINEGAITSYTYGKGVALPTNVTRDHYTFAGWFATEDLTGEAVTAIGAEETGNKTYYAKWTAVNYTAKVKYSFKEDVDEIEFNIENKADKLAELLAKKPDDTTEYSFAWVEEPTELELNNTQEFTVNRTANSFTVTLNVNDGVINEGDVTSYTYGEGVVLPTDVTKVGHTFAGWFASEGLTGEAVTAIGAEETGNKTYYAKWTVNQYTLSFVDESNQPIEGVNDITQDYNTEVTLPTLSTIKLGYVFTWYNGETKFTSTTMPAENLTLVGKWVKQSTNTFDSVTDTSATVNTTENKNEYVYFSESTSSDIYLSADITLTSAYTDKDWRIGFSIFGATENKAIMNILLERNATNSTIAKRIITLPKTSSNGNDWNGKSYNFTTKPDLASSIKLGLYKKGTTLYIVIDGSVVLSFDASVAITSGDLTVQSGNEYYYGLASWSCTGATFTNVSYIVNPSSDDVCDFMGSAQIVKTKVSSTGWNVNKVEGMEVTLSASVSQVNTQTARFSTTEAQQLEDSYMETYITLTTPVTDQDCRVGFCIYDETDDVELFNILFDMTAKNATTAKRIIVLPKTTSNANAWNGTSYTFATDAQPDLSKGIKFALYRQGTNLYLFVNDELVLTYDTTTTGSYNDVAWRTFDTTHQIVYGVTGWNTSKATFKNTQIFIGSEAISKKLELLGITIE